MDLWVAEACLPREIARGQAGSSIPEGPGEQSGPEREPRVAGVQQLLQVAQEARVGKGPRVVWGGKGGWAKKAKKERPGGSGQSSEDGSVDQQAMLSRGQARKGPWPVVCGRGGPRRRGPRRRRGPGEWLVETAPSSTLAPALSH